MTEQKPSEIIEARVRQLEQEVVKTVEGTPMYRSRWDCQFIAIKEFLNSHHV
jgi:hypothetical protein